LFENGIQNQNVISAPAVVASFSNGRLKLDENSANSIRIGYFCSKSANMSNRDEKMVVAETDRVRYVGRNFGSDALSAPTMCRYMLGVFDKRTNKIRVVDASMFHLRPAEGDSDDEGTGQDHREQEEQLTVAEKHARLTKEFGTAKGRRVVESRLRNQVKDKGLESVVADVVKESAESPSLLVDQTGQGSGPVAIPPHNKDATRPEDVYSLDDIISPAEMQALVGPAAVFVNATTQDIAEWREKGVYPGYIMHQLTILPVQASVRQHRACQLLYLSYMHRLLSERNQKLNETILLSDAPAIVRRTLYERFTMIVSNKQGKGVRSMPARLKDLLRSYMLVLCLIMEEFSLDFTALQRDLDLSLPQLEKCFQALGCKTSRRSLKAATGQTSKSFKATLVIPLTFPVYKARSGRR
jgi:DNA-directed RNA polymerase I subunit RPA49